MKVFKRKRNGNSQRYKVTPEGLSKRIVRALRPFCSRIAIAGSIRRGKPGNDVDIVLVVKGESTQNLYLDSEGTIRLKSRIGGNYDVWKKNHGAVWNWVHNHGKVKEYGMHNLFCVIDGINVDIFFSDPGSFEAQMMTRTGPAGANIWHRTAARKKGYLLNQYGLFDRKSGRRIADTEKGIYATLGLSYRDPALRGLPR